MFMQALLRPEEQSVKTPHVTVVEGWFETKNSPQKLKQF
jgi:hypothetical protein